MIKSLTQKYLVENVTSKWSFWIAAVAAVVAGLEQALPELRAVLPETWMPWVLVAIVVARSIKQGEPK